MFELHSQLAKDCLVLGQLPLCKVLLMNDSNYPWIILVPSLEGLKEIIDLDAGRQQQLWQESSVVSHLLKTVFAAEKLNIAALGNQVPQLHIHHIARFSADPAWPAPVWGRLPAQAYTEAGHATVTAKIVDYLSAHSPDFIPAS